MKPFSLKEYLKDPSKEVITRDGRPARIICTDKKSLHYPVVALIPQKIDDTEQVCIYTNDGRYFSDNETPSDLFFAPEKHEGWMNICKSGDCYKGSIIWPTEEEAKRCAYPGLSTIVKIEWEE